MFQARLWLLLALLAGHSWRQGRAGLCQDGREPREVWGSSTKCCPHCTWRAGDDTPCKKGDSDCRCPEGMGCSDKGCQSCQRLPRCEPGWEPHRIGMENFLFECRPCENGSYSSSRNSQCRNWTDCESSGYVTLRAGNSTHNSVCSLPVGPLERGWIPLEFPSSTILAILTAVAVFVLILLTFLLHFCIWSLRRDKKFPAADLGLSFPRPPPLQGEESHSIQFPEEEHGDKTAEEKMSSLSLKVYSELR